MLSLPERIRRSARLSGRFVLRSGEVSDTYFDKYQFEADPQLLRDICDSAEPPPTRRDRSVGWS
jgi:orotate phosphoribosyltransferase